MPWRKRIISEIESAGYRVTGFREALERKESGQLIVTAEKLSTGERHTVRVFSPGAEGETEALQKLAAELGLTGIDQQEKSLVIPKEQTNECPENRVRYTTSHGDNGQRWRTP